MGKKCCCAPTVAAFIVIVIGVIICVLGAAFMPLFKKLYDDKLKDRLVMKKGSESYTNWVEEPVPIYMEYYVFNYTNVEDILSSGAIPVVTQHGPYVYREKRINQVIEESEEEISYVQNYTYIFDPLKSCSSCTDKDVIQTPNVAVLTILNLLGSANVTSSSTQSKKFIIGFFSNFLQKFNASLFHKLSVRQRLWGYNSTLLYLMKADRADLEPALATLGLKFPSINPFVALQHNASDEAQYIGNVTLKTGKSSIDDLQRIIKWRGLSESPHWLNKYGVMLNGTDGTHFRPFLDKYDDPQIYVFITDICRSLYLTYESDQTIENINLYRYVMTKEIFANASMNPNNKAFCVGGCWKTGLLPIGQCIEGNPPIFASSPHFYQADDWLVQNIKGMQPNKSEHETLIDVEPVTGLTMRVHKRLQINVLAEIIPLISMTANLTHKQNFLPVMYLDETTTIDRKNSDKYKHEVVRPKIILKWVRYGLYILGGVEVVSGLIAFIVMIKQRRRNGHTRFS